MGVVYLAEDTRLGREVAIKFLSSSEDHHYRARFLREARSVSSLSHPNIATLYDYGESVEGQPFIVMEYIKGETLNDLLQKEGIGIKRAVEIIESVAEALAEAHSRGIIHRDIKPTNVAINDRGQVKVLDFGLAKTFREEPYAHSPEAQTQLATQTQSGIVVGTPLYLSPEQAIGGHVDARSDIFALGALLYECITGQPPFKGGTVLEIGAQVIHVSPRPPSSVNRLVPRELDRITMKALAKKVEDRYQTMEELAEDLRALNPSLFDSEAKTRRLETFEPLLRTSAFRTLSESLRKPRLSIITFVAAALVLLFVIGFAVRMRRSGPYIPSAEASQWYQKGTEALRDGAYQQASKLLERAVKADDRFALAHARLAEAWHELDYTDRAKDELVKVFSLVPDRSRIPEVEALQLEAIRATIAQDFAAAISSYEKIAARTPKQAAVYVDLGRAYEKNDETDKAIEAYLKAISLDSQYATAYLRAAIIYSRKSDPKRAEAALHKADSLYNVLQNLEGTTEVSYQRAALLRSAGKLRESRVELLSGLEITRTTGNESQRINILLDLSHVALLSGDTARAREYAQEAVDFAQGEGLGSLAAAGLINLGRAYFSTGDYAEAENHFTKAIEVARRNKAKLREAIGELNLGDLYIQQLRTGEGLALVEKALSFFQQANYSRYAATSLVHMGRARRQLGDYDGALQAFRQKLGLAQQANDQTEIAFSVGEIGAVLAEQENYPEALRQYDAGNSIYKSLGNPMLLGYNQHNRGNLLWRLGRYDEAREALAEALAIANQPDTTLKPLLAELELTYAEMALSELDVAVAKEKCQAALALAGSQYKGVGVKARCILALTRALAGARNASPQCEEAVETAERAGDLVLAARARLILGRIQLASGSADKALSNAIQAQETFARHSQYESEWRAWVVAARGNQARGDQQTSSKQFARASEVISKLRDRWTAEVFRTYSSRRDVQNDLRYLDGYFE